MNNIPIAYAKEPNYENLVVDCPSCGIENTFNRASDLQTFNSIDDLEVSCLNVHCGKAFRILGDKINNAHEILVFNCYKLIEQKHYMNTILTLAQAYEVFFNLFFRVELLYKPYGIEHNLEEVNRLSDMLYNKTKNHTFEPMKKLFLDYMVTNNPPRNFVEAEIIIANSTQLRLPSDTEIKNLNDSKLVPLLIAVKNTNINTLRNMIIHQRAYRPTRDEVNDTFEEAKYILFNLTNHLKLYDDINSYI